jgi:hypothetical protein
MVCLLALNWLLSFSDARAATVEPPPVGTIVTNVLERLQWAQQQGFRGQFAYTRVKASEQLDERGQVKEREEKTYEVLPIAGRPYSRWVKSQGKPLSEKERKNEEEREREARRQLAQTSTPPALKKELPLTPELLSRFVFTVEGCELLNGRPAWVLTFAPKSGELPVKKMQDRVANRMAGRVWIDTADFEIARAALHMSGEVSLVGGLVGVLRQFNYTLERVRVEAGVWFTTRTATDIAGRELFRSKRVRLVEDSSDFRRRDPERSAGASVGH